MTQDTNIYHIKIGTKVKVGPNASYLIVDVNDYDDDTFNYVGIPFPPNSDFNPDQTVLKYRVIRGRWLKDINYPKQLFVKTPHFDHVDKLNKSYKEMYEKYYDMSDIKFTIDYEQTFEKFIAENNILYKEYTDSVGPYNFKGNI